MMLRLLLFLSLSLPLFLAHSAESEPLRFWKNNKGQEIIGELVASDGVRVTLRIEDNSKKVFPLNFFTKADRDFVIAWRAENPNAPWVDPKTMPPWPQKLGSGKVSVRELTPQNSSPTYSYRSPHFEIHSDLQLPLSVTGDIATIFEATRIAVQTLPLGLAATPPVSEYQIRMQQKYPQLRYDPDLLQVQLYGDSNLYAQSGAPAGSGGFYHPLQNRTVLSLQNLGIKGKKGLYRNEYMKSAFVLKHEVTHHLLHDWSAYLPVWFQEGFAEYMGAAPYSQGYYQFVSMDRRLHKYMNKWRFNEDPKRIPIMEMEDLMAKTHADWASALRRSTPTLEYNSAAILVHFFIHHDDKGDASHLAAYLDAIRRGTKPKQAETKHLLRGRSHQQLDEEIRQVWLKNRVSLEPSGESDPFK